MSALRPTLGAFAVLTLVLVAACGSTAPSAAPSTPASSAGAPSDTPTAAQSDTPSSAPSGAVNGATWWVGSDLIPLAPDTTEIKGILVESACASGQSPEGRVNDPVIAYTPEAVTVTFTVEPLPGDAQDCQGNPEFPVTFTLSEPLGGRTLLDGGSTPPRDATTTP